MHFRIEPTRVVQGARFDKGDSWHDGRIGKDWRAAVRTKVPLNGLTAIASVVKGLELSLNRHRRLGDSDKDRERGPGLPLTVGAVAYADKNGIRIRQLSDVAA